MSEKFRKHWESDIHKPLFSRLKEQVNPGPPLKQRLSNTLYRLEVLSHRLKDTISKLEQRGRDFFDKCIEAQTVGDNARAVIYANECAEVQKIAKIVLRSQLALEQVMLRLETVRDFGDVVVQMSPVVSIVHAIKNQLVGVMPQVSYELGIIGETLNNFVVEAGETMGTGYDVIASGEEAQRILKEAGTVAEEKMREKFPELPTQPPSTTVGEKGASQR